MKLVNINKTIPILSILIFLFIISFNNQKQDTQLRILIWNTPSFSLGKYIAIAAGSGYLLSYLLTANLANVNRSKIREQIKYKADKLDENNSSYLENNHIISYDNTFIERDIKDPSPTVTASFRIISKTNRETELSSNNSSDEFETSDRSDEKEYKYYKQKINSTRDKGIDTTLDDWKDDTYINW